VGCSGEVSGRMGRSGQESGCHSLRVYFFVEMSGSNTSAKKLKIKLKTKI